MLSSTKALEGQTANPGVAEAAMVAVGAGADVVAAGGTVDVAGGGGGAVVDSTSTNPHHVASAIKRIRGMNTRVEMGLLVICFMISSLMCMVSSC